MGEFAGDVCATEDSVSRVFLDAAPREETEPFLATGSNSVIHVCADDDDDEAFFFLLVVVVSPSSSSSLTSVFCFSVCSLARGMISQFAGRCQTVFWVVAL